MKAVLIEDGDNGKKIAHNSLVIDDPKIFSALDNPISLKILKTLAETPNSGMNISRKLRIDEQKIYYYLRKLEKAGIIYPISSEKHRGMVSQIYTIVSPVISAKLVDNGVEVKNVGKVMPPDTAEFFAPFVENGSINCKIIIGNTKTHGKYEARAVDSPYLIDFLLFLGSMTHNFDHSHISYRFDTDVTDDELKNNNLILIGNPKINSVTDRINESLPIFFDVHTDFRIISRITENKYPYDYDAVIIKTNNPFNEDKQMLLLAGRRSEGLRSAILAVMSKTKEILNGNIKNKDIIAKVVTGVDKNSDGVIDWVKFHE